MEMKKENVTSLERLQGDLFANYNMFTIPKGVSKIYMGSAIKGVTYNEMKSIFQVRLEFKLVGTVLTIIYYVKITQFEYTTKITVNMSCVINLLYNKKKN